MRVIALCANKGSGKNYISDLLVDLLQEECPESNIIQYGLADPIKEVASILFGWSYERIEEHKEEPDIFYGISPREFLQFMGTEIAQEQLCQRSYMYDLNVNRNLWMTIFSRRMRDVSADSIVIIHDLRFPHEERFLRENYLDSSIWKVVTVLDEKDVYTTSDSHLSERLIDQVEHDTIVFNYMNNRDRTILEIKERRLLWQ